MKRIHKIIISLASFLKFIINDNSKTQKIDSPQFIQEIKKGNIQDVVTLQERKTIKGIFKQKVSIIRSINIKTKWSKK